MKDNIYIHNLRLNLKYPEELELHRALMNFDPKEYKSKNDYLKKKAYEGVRGDDIAIRKLEEDTEANKYVTQEEFKQKLDKVVNDVLKELSAWFMRAMMSERYAPVEATDKKMRE
jgi:hypothetical protein